LSIPGLYFLYKTQKKFAIFSIFAFILCGPVYFFYAGFPLFSNFHFGSIERFFLAPYAIFIIWYAIGIKTITDLIDQFIYKYFHELKIKSVLLFMIIPLFSFMNNYYKMIPLKYDLTAENLGRDILETVPDNSMILISDDDTAYFDTLYIYNIDDYKSKENHKIFLSSAMLRYTFYRQTISQEYPQVTIPDNFENLENPTEEFIKANFNKFPIFSISKIYLSGNYYWMPYGLVLKLHNNDKTPITEIKFDNEKLIIKYQDPTQGALKFYEHLILSDVLRVYAYSYLETAKIMLISQEFTEAEKYLLRSKNLQPQFSEIDFKLVIAYIGEKKCPEAKDILKPLEVMYSNLDELKELKTRYQAICEKQN
jgi:hypothetical protein